MGRSRRRHVAACSAAAAMNQARIGAQPAASGTCALTTRASMAAWMALSLLSRQAEIRAAALRCMALVVRRRQVSSLWASGAS